MENSENLTKFRKIDRIGVADVDLDIPALSQERSVTDKKGFLLYGIAILLYCSLFAYYIADESTKVESSGRTKRSIFNGNSEMRWQYFPKFVAIIVITSGLCVLFLYSLVRAPTVVMWVIIYNSIVVFGILTYLSYLFLPNWNIRQNPALIIPISLGLLAVLSVFLSCIFHKTLKSLTLLYQEVAKVLFAMPTLLTPAIMITVVQAIFLCISVTIVAPMATITLKEQQNLEITLLISTLIMLFFTVQITFGFQSMLTAGSVACWYFAPFRLFLETPVLKSVTIAAKFHVGTIVLGAFCHPFVEIAKFLTMWSRVATYLGAFSMRNGLVVSALHGQGFFKSARRARDSFEGNLLGSVKFNSDFMVWLFRVHMLVYSSVISLAFFVDVDKPYTPMVICTAVNVIVIFVVFETFETTIYTLLVCYCEDKCIHRNTPNSYYFMTMILNDIFNNTKQERYKKNLLLGHRTIATGNNYAMFV